MIKNILLKIYLITRYAINIIDSRFRMTSSISRDKALSILEEYSPDPGFNCKCVNIIEKGEHNADLQIVVPIYNAKTYLRECVNSILNQETQYSFKVVLIDDGSKDSSGRIADEYSKDSRVKVIHQQNRGFSGARNAGLKNICADYIMFVDSDDRLDQGAIQNLMQVAKRENADIVQGGYNCFSDTTIWNGFKYNKESNVNSHDLQGYPWGKVFSSTLFKYIQFPENYWFEDTIDEFIIYPMSKNSWVIPQSVYCYRQNPNGISNTATYNRKCLDTFWITIHLIEEHKRMKLEENEDYISQLRRQMCLNAGRVHRCPLKVKYSVFRLTAESFIKQYEKLPSVNNESNKQLYWICKNLDFPKFEYMCNCN